MHPDPPATGEGTCRESEVGSDHSMRPHSAQGRAGSQEKVSRKELLAALL